MELFMEDEIPSVKELRKARQSSEIKQKQEAGWKKIKNLDYITVHWD